jgi:putative transposase
VNFNKLASTKSDAIHCGIAQYLQFYNSERPHQAHSQAAPDEAYFAALPFAKMQAA